MSTPRQHIVVMKFGGTSVEDSAAIQRTAAIVALVAKVSTSRRCCNWRKGTPTTGLT